MLKYRAQSNNNDELLGAPARIVVDDELTLVELFLLLVLKLWVIVPQGVLEPDLFPPPGPL